MPKCARTLAHVPAACGICAIFDGGGVSSLCEAGKDADALGKRILLDVVGGGGGLLGYLEVSRHQNVNGGGAVGKDGVND